MCGRCGLSFPVLLSLYLYFLRCELTESEAHTLFFLSLFLSAGFTGAVPGFLMCVVGIQVQAQANRYSSIHSL